jgi:hypothetical protein
VDCQAQAIASVFLDSTDWDQHAEEERVVARFDALSRRFEGDVNHISACWHKVFWDGDPLLETWDEFSDGLLELAGCNKWHTREDERELSLAYTTIRVEWMRLETGGMTAEWLRGVGKGGPHEWTALMYKVLDHAKQRGDDAAMEHEFDYNDLLEY